MAGLTAARQLTRHGWDVVLLDKGRGVGGRLATRRIEIPGPGQTRFDHGAPYLSARTSDFQRQIDDWLQAGVLQNWLTHPNGEVCYVAPTGMNGLAKYLAQSLTIHTGNAVTRIESLSDGWLAQTEAGITYRAQSLLVTIPAPQAIALLQHSDIEPPAALSAIVYEPCLAALVLLNGPGRVPAPGEVVFADGPVARLVDNRQKGISAEPTLTVYARADFSRAYLDGDLAAAGQQLLGTLADLIPPERVQSVQVHRWRYSQTETTLAEPLLALPTPQPLLLGGDGFGPGQVEGAFLSGLRLAEWLIERQQ